MLNPSIALGGGMAFIFAAGLVTLVSMGSPPQVGRAIDVTEMNVVGVGCGEPASDEATRIWVAREEDELPGPTCDIVFSLHDPR